MISTFFGWLWRYWFNILSLTLAILGLSWVARAIDRHRHKRDVDIILVGLKSAGKTDLWNAWLDDRAPKSNAKPTAIRTPIKLPPAPWGRYTLYPTVVDDDGAKPESMMNSILNAPRRAKRVLIFVVAPSRLNVASAPSFDHDYIREQVGYAYFPRALIGASDARIRPDLVILFVTKFDLLSDIPPSGEILAELEQEFDEIIQQVRSACKRTIPFKLIVGSAKVGWGVQELRESVTKLLLPARK